MLKMLPALALLLAATVGVHAQDAFVATEPRAVAGADIEVVNEIGRTHVLADFLPVGEPGIVHFWATWCGPCRAELPGLAEYARNLANSGLRDRLIVIAVEPSSREKIDRFLDDLGLDGFVTLQDRGNRSGAIFGLFGMPATVLTDANGRVIGRHSGPLDWSRDTVRAELAAHLEV